jgi:6-phosphofructokinase 2
VPPILTITLNPAVDIATGLDKLLPQRKLRCDAPRFDPGGGGVNVSRAIKELGGESRAFVVVGGRTGRQLRELLEQTGLDCDFWEQAAETRFSFMAMEGATGLHYRFVMPGTPLEAGAAEPILAHLFEEIAARPGLVVASGSLPPGLANDFYGRLAAPCREAGARLIVDTHGDALNAAARSRPYLIRLNHLEAQELVGGGADGAAHLLAHRLVDQHLAEVAIVTLGERGAIVASAAGIIEITAPKVTMRSGVGAGDSFVAALTVGLARGWPLEDAARYGVAAAAAAVTTEATELCKREVVDTLFAAMGDRAAIHHQLTTVKAASPPMRL